MRRAIPALLAVLLLLVRLASAPAQAAQWVVVTAPAFRAELTPLIEQRRDEGLEVVVIETTDVLTPEQIRRGDGAALQHHLASRTPPGSGTNYLLLAGAVPTPGATNELPFVVPAVPGKIGRMNGRPGDYGYGVPDTNGMPTLAVGRFPARTLAELRCMVQKTLDLERARGPVPWRNRLLLLAGDTAGGPLADMMIEQVVAPRFEQLHPSWSLRAIFASASSRYYLPANLLRAGAIRGLEAGDLFSVFLGHSTASGMWLTDTNYLSRDDWARLKIDSGRGVFFTCGCFACQFQGKEGQGYGLVAIRNPRGPAAVIGACAESYAAPGQLALDGLLQCLGKAPFPARLADYWLAVQAGLARGEMDPVTFSFYDRFDGTKGKVPLSVQRREHLEMWMLLGDPALRLPVVSTDVSLQVKEPVRSGRRVAVNGVLPASMVGATVRVTLERPIGSLPFGLAKLPAQSDANRESRERIATDNYERANDFVLAAVETKPAADAFVCQLEAPSSLPWSNVVIRATATTATDSAIGVMTLPVSR